MSALDDIEAATVALNALTVQEAAEKARIDAAVSAALKATTAVVKAVFVDAVAGLDTNDGLTTATALKTLNAALPLFGAGQYGLVYLLSDVVVSQQLVYVCATLAIESYGVKGDGTGGTIRTLTLDPAALPPAALVGAVQAAVVANIRANLFISNVNLKVGAFAAPAIGVMNPRGTVVFENSIFTLDPALAVPLFMVPDEPTSYEFGGVTLPAKAVGLLFAGVAAGANPNSFRISTNLTSA